ncbi:MAG TPA: STAS domain-containing protein [Gemmataceae bacterium]|nr:STAS domain-containing protein [Gemmataceae bacterium]
MPSLPYRWFRTEAVGPVTVVRFPHPGALTGEAVGVIADQLFQLVDEGGCRRLVVNLANVEGLDSAMLGKLLVLNQKLLALGGRMKLCRVPEPIAEVLETARLPDILGIYEDESQALESF